MPITAQCTCGKRISVSDALAGKTIRCTACGQGVFVAPNAAPPPTSGKKPATTTYKNASGKTVTKYATSAPAIYISKGKIVGLSVIGGIVLLIFLAVIGPVRVYNQWQADEPKINGDVSDVITFGLQAYLSNQGAYNPNEQHRVPAIDSPIVFLGPLLNFSRPERVLFRGKSNQGDFVGVYNTRTGDIEADVSYGGYSVAGMVNIAKATGKFHMTGRMANGFPQAEIDGQPIQIVYPPAPPS